MLVVATVAPFSWKNKFLILKCFNVAICNASQTRSLENDIVLNYYSDAQGRIITAPVRQMSLFAVVRVLFELNTK